jgi:very-short-patch-repair endonuclease
VRLLKKDAALRARKLRGDSTPAEETLWSHLRDRRLLGLKFRRQAPIGPYVADFLCHELRLILELDGPIHDEEAQIAHDLNRDANLKALGYRILRVTNQEIQDNLTHLFETIRSLHHRRTALD